MQLKHDGRDGRRRLMAASCALLGAAGTRAALADDDTLTVDSAVNYYQEQGRVRAIEPIISVRRANTDGAETSLKLTYDSLSGSSPNGALTSTQPQTFASPSGNTLNSAPQTYTTASGQTVTSPASTYRIAAGQLPMDPNFRDQRLALDGMLQRPLSRLLRWRIGGSASYERDFDSLTGNAGLSRDFNERDTTLSLGVNDEFDKVRPIGGAPLPGTDYSLFLKTGGRQKNGVGALLGVTQVLNRHWLAQLNLSADRFTGYLNDPYKIVSIIDSSGTTTGYLFEKRPGSRLQRSVYLENRLGFARASATLALRYMSDDWQVHSSTAELTLRWWNPLHDRYLQPSVRWYGQSAASFYQPWLWAGSATTVPSVSADERLGAFTALTAGLKYALVSDPASGDEFSVRLEFYRQTPRQLPAAPAALQDLPLFPGLRAVNLQFGYRFSY